MHYFYYDLSGLKTREWQKPPRNLRALQCQNTTSLRFLCSHCLYCLHGNVQGFEQPSPLSEESVRALMANNGAFTSVKGPARWREDHAPYTSMLPFWSGKGPKSRKNKWDLFKVLGYQGGDSVMPTLKSLGY